MCACSHFTEEFSTLIWYLERVCLLLIISAICCCLIKKKHAWHLHTRTHIHIPTYICINDLILAAIKLTPHAYRTTTIKNMTDGLRLPQSNCDWSEPNATESEWKLSDWMTDWTQRYCAGIGQAAARRLWHACSAARTHYKRNARVCAATNKLNTLALHVATILSRRCIESCYCCLLLLLPLLAFLCGFLLWFFRAPQTAPASVWHHTRSLYDANCTVDTGSTAASTATCCRASLISQSLSVHIYMCLCLFAFWFVYVICRFMFCFVFRFRFRFSGSFLLTRSLF